MKIALTVVNTSKTVKPSKDDVIIYDGKEWYVTTKDDVLKESKDLLNECKLELENLRKEHELFKKEIATQLLEMSELIKKLYSTTDEK